MSSSGLVERVHEAHLFMLQCGSSNANWSVQLNCDDNFLTPISVIDCSSCASPSSCFGLDALSNIEQWEIGMADLGKLGFEAAMNDRMKLLLNLTLSGVNFSFILK